MELSPCYQDYFVPTYIEHNSDALEKMLTLSIEWIIHLTYLII